MDWELIGLGIAQILGVLVGGVLGGHVVGTMLLGISPESWFIALPTLIGFMYFQFLFAYLYMMLMGKL